MNSSNLFLVLLIVTICLLIAIIVLYFTAKKRAASKLLSIEAKGYKWAAKPWHNDDIYISAKKESVDKIGHFPNGRVIYKTESGKSFYAYDDGLTEVIIDILNHVHFPSSKKEMGLLVIDDDPNLIIPENTFIIKEPTESNDFLVFYTNVETYLDPDHAHPLQDYYEWDAEIIN